MINLEHLTEQERKIIMDVLQRDEQLRQSEQERVNEKLKTELHELRRKSAVKVDEDSGDSGKKVCARCREPLGTIFNSGEVCPRCQHKVCSSCKVLLPNTKKWLCTICNKHLQIRLESGEAFGPKGEGQAEAYGSDLVKMSLTKNKTGRDPIVHVNGGPQSPADSGFHGRGGANVPSVGESNSTTFDEDYPSDVSYEQSMVSGMESIGPSVSQRGTVVSNGVEGGLHDTADITMERIPSRNGSPATSRRGRQGGDADLNMQDSKCNASESGIGSIHSGYTNQNEAGGNFPLPVDSSNSQIVNQPSAVQFSSNNRFKSELAFTTKSNKSLEHSSKGGRYDLSIDRISVDKVEDQFTTNSSSLTTVLHPDEGEAMSVVSEEEQGSAPSFRASPLPQLANPSPSCNTTSPAPLTNPHTGSPRPSRHVTNRMHVSTAGLSVHNKPTSNSDEFDTPGSERVYVGSGDYDFQYQSVSDDMDQTPGDESSRQSDTDSQSITSSSTVAWDTIADAKEMDAKKANVSSESDRQCITIESSDNQSTGTGHVVQESNLIKNNLQQHGIAIASSGYESASSVSVSSESRLKTNGMLPGGPVWDIGSRKIVLDGKMITISPACEYPMLQYLNSDGSPDEFVILESEEVSPEVSLSEKLAPNLFPNIENNNIALTMEPGQPKYDGVSSVSKKDMALADVLYLQEQGSLLQNLQSDNSADKANTAAQQDSNYHERDLGSEEKLAETHPSSQDHIHDLGSINSHYVASHEKDDDSSDCSSIDLSKLDFSDSSDTDMYPDFDHDNTGRKVLLLGGEIATLQNTVKEEYVSEWGFDDTDGLVPLVLPGMSSGMSSGSEVSVKGEESDSRVSSFLRRFMGTPLAPPKPSPPDRNHSDDEDDSERFSGSLDISSDSDSRDETHLQFDPSLIADSSEEKEACYKSKLEYNKALMRSLLKEQSTEEDSGQTSSGKEQTVRMKTGPQSVDSPQSPQSSNSEASEKNVQKRFKRSSKNTVTASTDGSVESKPRRKKKGKSNSKLDDAEASVGYASKKGLMKQSKTPFGVLSSTPDGKTQLYTFGGDKDRPMGPADLNRGRYTPLKDAGVNKEGSKPLDRPKTPYVCQSVPQPRIYRKQPSTPNLPATPRSLKTDGDNDSDSELSVIIEEPEEFDADLEQSYDSKL
eukprot:XP_011684221.1 PREDICTED: dentin sialophosphoprotein-like [Strongylocentrotus purpuratus]